MITMQISRVKRWVMEKINKLEQAGQDDEAVAYYAVLDEIKIKESGRSEYTPDYLGNHLMTLAKQYKLGKSSHHIRDQVTGKAKEITPASEEFTEKERMLFYRAFWAVGEMLTGAA